MKKVDDGLDDARRQTARPGQPHWRPTGRIAYTGEHRETSETPARRARREKWEARNG